MEELHNCHIFLFLIPTNVVYCFTFLLVLTSLLCFILFWQSSHVPPVEDDESGHLVFNNGDLLNNRCNYFQHFNTFILIFLIFGWNSWKAFRLRTVLIIIFYLCRQIKYWLRYRPRNIRYSGQSWRCDH